MKKIAIIGTAGAPARYGGFETLVHHLVQQWKGKYETTVYCSKHYYEPHERPKQWEGANLVYLPFNANGAQSIIYDIVSMFHAIFYANYLGKTQLLFLALPLLINLAIPIIIELVGKGTACVWLQQTTVVRLPYITFKTNCLCYKKHNLMSKIVTFRHQALNFKTKKWPSNSSWRLTRGPLLTKLTFQLTNPIL